MKHVIIIEEESIDGKDTSESTLFKRKVKIEKGGEFVEVFNDEVYLHEMENLTTPLQKFYNWVVKLYWKKFYDLEVNKHIIG